MVSEGEPEEVARFIASVQDRMDGVIKETNLTIEDASGEFSEFTVLY